MNRRERSRIAIATSCNDAATIPKVPEAGQTGIDQRTGRVYQVMHNGLKVYDDTHFGPFMTPIIRCLRGHHEPQEEWVFHVVLPEIPKAGVMVELGAHWSYYSMWFLREVEEISRFIHDHFGRRPAGVCGGRPEPPRRSSAELSSNHGQF